MVKRCNGCREHKCDQAVPACTRCQRGGRECTYRDDFDSAHRDQRVVAKASAEKKWRQRANNSLISDEGASSEGRVSDLDTPIPLRGLRDSLHQLAHQRFRYDFVMPSGVNSPAKGTFAKLDYLYSIAPEDSSLYCAVTAVSYANFHGRLKSEEAKHASGVYYGKSLQKLAGLMAMNPANIESDEILVVILVLGLYETLTSAHHDGFWAMHMRGTQSVITNRETHSNDGNFVFASLCLHLLVYYIGEKVAPPPFFHRLLAQVPVSFGQKVKLSGYMAETARLCAELKAETETFGSSTDLSELLNSALSLDSSIQVWSSHLPLDRSYTMQPINPTDYPPWATALLSSHGAPKMMGVFSSPLAASDWNMYRATRIQLNRSILDFLAARSLPLDAVFLMDLKCRTLENINTLSSQIASSIPYSLLVTPGSNSAYPESVEKIPGLWGYLLVWPVSIAFFCYERDDSNTTSQKQWLGSVLRFLRDALGIAKAEAILAR